MAELRLAAPDDLAAVEALVHEAYCGYIARIGQQPGPMLEDYVASIAAGAVHVLAEGDAIVGILVLIPERDAMLLDNIAVHPAAQGKGYGRRLLDFAESQARTAGFRAIRLYTHELMTENQTLYRRTGYIETHRAAEQGLKRVFMTKRLDPC